MKKNSGSELFFFDSSDDTLLAAGELGSPLKLTPNGLSFEFFGQPNYLSQPGAVANAIEAFNVVGTPGATYDTAQPAGHSSGAGVFAAAAVPAPSSVAISTHPDTVETTDAAASTATTYVLSVGQSGQGNISAAGDHDWFRVDLVANQTYSFAEIGTGTHSLENTFLNLRNSAGTSVGSDDDSGPAGSSSLTYTPSDSGTYYLDAGSHNDQTTGQYGVSVTQGSRPSFDISMGAGAIDAYDTWSTRGTEATITYGFRQSAPGYTVNGSDISTFTEVSPAEMTALKQILQLWSEVANVHFASPAAPDGGYTDNSTILIGNYNDPNDPAGAFAFYPGSTASVDEAGDLWLNLNSVSTTSIPVGSYSFFAIMHELGHALGLSHPGDYDAGQGGSITYANSAQFTQDSEQYSVMSYFGGSDTGASPGGFATGYTPMIFDIAELQNLYGVNTTTRSDDTTYGFGTNAGSIYAFTAGSFPPLFCIWDAGGTDKLDCSGFSQTELINLNEGTFSNVGGGTANLSIALGVTIENATGGSGNDTILGNNVANLLDGGAGNDTLIGGAGMDTVRGGLDNDTLAVVAGDIVAGETYDGGDGTDTLSVIGAVDFTGITITSVEALGFGIGPSSATFTTSQFGSGQLSSSLAVAGNAYGNALIVNMTSAGTFDATQFTFTGWSSGQDSVTINGAGGADTIMDAAVNTVLRGGAGNDTYFVHNAGDTISEAANEGTADRVYASVNYTLTAGAAVENLSTDNDAGTSAITLIGNEFAQTITGNAGNNTLKGGGGTAADVLSALGGNDYYYVTHAGDRIVEVVNGGTDRVYASVNYTLTAGAEIETITTDNSAGTNPITLIGNEFAQSIFGNAGANTLKGGGGTAADVLSGLGGNDYYYVNHAGDHIVEAVNGGTDRVYASVSYALNAGAEIESITTDNSAATTAINLTGNEFAQSIVGNVGNNTINGGLGNDTLTGAGGNDQFLFSTKLNASTNVDHIADFTVSTGTAANVDKIQLDDAIFAALNPTHVATPFTLASTAFSTSAPANANQHIIYNTATGALFYDDDGSGAHTAIQFAILNAHPALSNADLLVV